MERSFSRASGRKLRDLSWPWADAFSKADSRRTMLPALKLIALVTQSQVVLRFGVALVCCHCVKFHRFALVFDNAGAVVVANSKVVDSGRVALFNGLFVPVDCLG